MTDTSFAIADLQSRWYTLNDLDRAGGIAWQLAHWISAEIADIQVRQRALELAYEALTDRQVISP